MTCILANLLLLPLRSQSATGRFMCQLAAPETIFGATFALYRFFDNTEVVDLLGSLLAPGSRAVSNLAVLFGHRFDKPRHILVFIFFVFFK